VLIRAVYWYQAALPKLNGLAKTKVEKRLDEIRAVLSAGRKPIDVLARIDPKKNSLSGEWQVSRLGVGIQNARAAYLEIPVHLGNNYELELECTCSGSEISIVLPVGGQYCAFRMIAEGSGLAYVNSVGVGGSDAALNPTLNKLVPLEKNRRFKVRCKV